MDMNNMPGGQPQMEQPIPNQPAPPYGQQPIPNQPAPPYGQQPMPNQPMPSYGQQPVPNQPISPTGQPIPPYGQQPMPNQPIPPTGQPMPPYGQQPMPNQPIPPMGQPMPPYGMPYRPQPQLIVEPMKKLDDAPSLLECRNLTKSYVPGRNALNHMNIRIEKGHIVGLLGPNGSGKTTLIKIINGLLVPTEGEVLINGQHPGPYTKSVVSYLPERTYLEAQKDVKSLVEFFADFYADFRADRAYAMLDALGIPPKARLKTLSKGNKEKVQLILVMSRDAQLFVLDEPIAGVDPAARDYILRTILGNYNPNATLLICTHLISDIENILDDVIFIKNGNLVVQSTADQIRSRFHKSVDMYFREVFAC